jgi:beta-glucanase (GH16 family)
MVEVWPETGQDWVDVWRDDFDGPAQGAPDATWWNVEYRPMGYNGELDFNTNERRNSYTDGNGNLVIQALEERYVEASGVTSTQPYTSARLNTQGKMEQTYGKFEARIKLPQGGRGVWPAFWMLGNDIDSIGWPDCGEVDILEWRGSKPRTITGSLHGPGYSGGNSFNDSQSLASGSFADEFHVFAFEWTADAARWSIDGVPYFVKTKQGVENTGARWAYDHPFFIILNLAIGGIFDGTPGPDTVFPQQMLIDYVSVAQLAPTAP